MVLVCDRTCDQPVTNSGSNAVTAWDAAQVIERLEQAGRTLLSLPNLGYRPGGSGQVMSWQIVRSFWEGCQSTLAPPIRPAAPSAKDVTDMDEAYAWLPWVRSDGARRIIQARSLVNPVTNEYVHPWRRIADGMGTHPTQVQRWHARGIAVIVANLQATGKSNRA